ncbi:transporter [uncultured Pseudomonas sp.]|uniref:transporter n=1 Tax=uncultured Pseudomonas sp. TaxID=114707 RepID=UPI002635D4C2|nr:transporter [uncultured Pseudomonas sp.]
MKSKQLVGACLCLWVSAGLADDTAELAKKTQNPIAALYSLPIQYNWNQHVGPSNDGIQTVTNIQPVLPFSINQEWNLISRTILPVIDQRSLVPNGLADKSGVGDVTQSLFFSPKAKTDNGWIWGAGPVFLMPTGSDDLLTNDQWAAGPTAVALKQSNGWTYGALANHLWSLEGSPADGREKINASFLQPFLSYTTSTYTTFGLNTESSYDWRAKEWSVPVNLTVTQLLKLGDQPLSIQVGPRYWVDSTENGADGWGFRAAVTLLFPR